MSKILQIISDHVRESFGNPVRLRRLLGDRPDLKVDLLGPVDNIDMRRVPGWHQLISVPARQRSERIELKGWRTQGNHHTSFIQHSAALDNLVRRTTVEAWACDLQDVHGFANSKSDLAAFRSTDEMVKTNSPEMITDVSVNGLRKNLAHTEIGLLRDRPTDWLQVHQWDKRMYVVNDGGSHHLAAAKLIAARIGAPVPLRVPLHYYSIDPDAVALLRSDYDMYLVSAKPELANAFFDAMESYGATWLWHEMPRPYESAKAIFLPRGEGPSMRVSAALRDAGLVDLGQHLEDVARSGMPEILQRRMRSQGPDVGDQNDEDETNNDSPRA